MMPSNSIALSLFMRICFVGRLCETLIFTGWRLAQSPYKFLNFTSACLRTSADRRRREDAVALRADALH
jgi:hypothetical protein